MSKKPVLLLLHGALGSKDQFIDLTNLLIDHFELHTINFEGHGGLESNSPFSIQLFSQNVLNYLVENEIERTHIFGYSMGGYVALQFAKDHPNRVGRIITLATKFNWDEESTQKEVRMLNPQKVEEKVPHFANKLKNIHSPLDWKEVMNKTAQMMVGLSKGNMLISEDFGKIMATVTISIGDLDNMVTKEESKLVVTLLENATFIQLPGFVHALDQNDVNILSDLIVSSILIDH